MCPIESRRPRQSFEFLLPLRVHTNPHVEIYVPRTIHDEYLPSISYRRLCSIRARTSPPIRSSECVGRRRCSLDTSSERTTRLYPTANSYIRVSLQYRYDLRSRSTVHVYIFTFCTVFFYTSSPRTPRKPYLLVPACITPIRAPPVRRRVKIFSRSRVKVDFYVVFPFLSFFFSAN